LSIAALDITSLALRDFAISRLPNHAKTSANRPTQAQALKSSAFRPSSSIAELAMSASRPVVTPSPRPANRDLKPNKATSTRRLRWLCLDHCETIDPQLVEYLRTKIPFVSAGKVRNEDRIRGKGQFHWDLEYYDSCIADDPKVRCKLVAIPGQSPFDRRGCS
jgi:hypothetical protein